jgi:hypothetical protein
MKKIDAVVVQLEEQLSIQIGDRGAVPTSPLKLHFKQIDYKTAMKVLIKNHYLHRKAPTSWAYGAYFDGYLIGACTIGKPASHTLIEGVSGKQNAKRVFELNRLWLSDDAPKNSESRFLGWILRTIPKGTILVSYADSAYKHIGKVYQATNWIFTGTSIPFTDYTIIGKDHRSIPKEQRIKENLTPKVRSKKYRYVYFTNREDRKDLLWKQKDYPTLI